LHQGVSLTPIQRFSWQVPAFPVGNDVSLEPGQQISLSQNGYGSLNAKSGAVVSLSGGAYFFADFFVESQATLSLDARNASVVVYVGGTFSFKGAITVQGDPSNVLFVALNAGRVDVMGSFRGTLVAPAATIRLATTAGGHTGSFFG